MTVDDCPAGPERPARRHRLVRRVLLTALSFSTLLGLLSVGAIAYVYRKYDGQIQRVDGALQTRDPNIREAKRQAHAENFLVIGSDTRQGADAGFGDAAGQRSDTTILVHLSADHERATVVSFPRDAWVPIPRCTGLDGRPVAAHDQLFNSAFAIGGPGCTVAAVQKLTGIAVTHFVQIDFVGFKNVVNALGTVAVCSPEAVYDAQSHLRLQRGENRLDGKQALRYVRARESLGDGSDLGRIKRQQQFLGVVLRQTMSGSVLSNPAKLTRFLDAATRSITVDRGTSFQDLRTLAGSLHGLDPRRVLFYTAPIADPDYAPPGTTLSGKVRLDAVKGAALYRSVIEDRSAPAPPAPGGRSSARPSGGSASSPGGSASSSGGSASSPGGSTPSGPPKPQLDAGEKTCRL